MEGFETNFHSNLGEKLGESGGNLGKIWGNLGEHWGARPLLYTKKHILHKTLLYTNKHYFTPKKLFHIKSNVFLVKKASIINYLRLGPQGGYGRSSIVGEGCFKGILKRTCWKAGGKS